MRQDIHSTLKALAEGRTTIEVEMAESLRISEGPSCEFAFTRSMFDDALKVAALPQPADSALMGLAISTKDLFEIRGQTTLAGSKVMEGSPPAVKDALAIERLKGAGGIVIGRTNMTEFAFSGVGVNPHHGTPALVPDGTRLRGPARIPGGSSSGAAVTVASGAAFVGLGSDTGGSIRIPAALNGIVGFKNTARLTPAAGALPLSKTLDTVCAMTRSVRDAILVHEIISATNVKLTDTPLAERKFAVVRTVFMDGLDPKVTRAFEQTMAALREAGAVIEEIDLPEIDQLAEINATGGFSAAESYKWHEKLLAAKESSYDPRVAMRITKGAAMTPAQFAQLVADREAWIGRMEAALAGFDAVLSPTVPIVAPLLSSVSPGEGNDEEFFRVNALLLRNPSIVNMLDGCAMSIPCHDPGQLPVGLMIWHAALHDDAILDIALKAERVLVKN